MKYTTSIKSEAINAFPPRPEEQEAAAQRGEADQSALLDPWITKAGDEVDAADNSLINNLAAIANFAELAENPAARPVALKRIRQICAELDRTVRVRAGLPIKP